VLASVGGGAGSFFSQSLFAVDCHGFRTAIDYVTSGTAAAVVQRKATAIVKHARVMNTAYIVLSLQRRVRKEHYHVMRK